LLRAVLGYGFWGGTYGRYDFIFVELRMRICTKSAGHSFCISFMK
jgi:hypothetical protein